jgi:lipoprotein NlpD
MNRSVIVYASTGLTVGLAIAAVAGCAARAATSPPVVTRAPRTTPAVPAPQATDGVIHVVHPGQTLWRIARAYGVDIEEVQRANDISDPSRIENGQELRIPGVESVRDVPAFPAPIPDIGRPHPLEAPMAAAVGEWTWPVPGGEVVGHFGDSRRKHSHAGLDIRGRAGEPVVAARDGRVCYCGGTLRGYGLTVVIDHGDGTSSLYGHNSKLLVREGQDVHAGQEIARVGSSGNATTPHCHFEIRRDDRPLDPLPLLEAHATGTR